eukprot:scaffold295_cov96-Cylindrotheca_fusiformis.AAC.1
MVLYKDGVAYGAGIIATFMILGVELECLLTVGIGGIMISSYVQRCHHIDMRMKTLMRIMEARECESFGERIKPNILTLFHQSASSTNLDIRLVVFRGYTWRSGERDFCHQQVVFKGCPPLMAVWDNSGHHKLAQDDLNHILREYSRINPSIWSITPSFDMKTS